MRLEEYNFNYQSNTSNFLYFFSKNAVFTLLRALDKSNKIPTFYEHLNVNRVLPQHFILLYYSIYLVTVDNVDVKT